MIIVLTETDTLMKEIDKIKFMDFISYPIFMLFIKICISIPGKLCLMSIHPISQESNVSMNNS